MGGVMREISVILLAVIGVAAIAVIVSRGAQTPAVLEAGGSAFARSLAAAVSPVMSSGYGSGNFGTGYTAF